MTAIQAFVKRHTALAYFVLVFAISWGGFLAVIGGPAGIPATPEQFAHLLPFAIPPMLLGPALAGILATGVAEGRTGYRNLVSRLLQWRVSAGWYAIALATAPIVFASVHGLLSLASPDFLPGIVTADNTMTSLLSGLIGGIVVGIFEELGWTGFAIPRMRERYGVTATGLIVGVVWGAWHLLANNLWAGRISAGELSVTLYVAVNGIILLFGQLLAFRVLMVWVYESTGSLLIAMLMHASLTASTFIFGVSVPEVSGVALLVYGFALAAAWWMVVAAVVVVSRLPLARRSRGRQVA